MKSKRESVSGSALRMPTFNKAPIEEAHMRGLLVMKQDDELGQYEVWLAAEEG